MEIAVKRIVSGVDVKPTATVENPESLKSYYKFRQLQHIDRKPRAKL